MPLSLKMTITQCLLRKYAETLHMCTCRSESGQVTILGHFVEIFTVLC